MTDSHNYPNDRRYRCSSSPDYGYSVDLEPPRCNPPDNPDLQRSAVTDTVADQRYNNFRRD